MTPRDRHPAVQAAAALPRMILAYARTETLLLLRNGESLLVTLVIPLGLLVFFATVEVLPAGGEPPLDILVPGILALALISSAMVSLGIATAFERRSLALKRLGTTPLPRGGLVAGKMLALAGVLALQTACVLGAGLALGWRPAGGLPGPATLLAAAGLLLLGAVAFAGLGLLMAGTLRAEATLALANGLYLLMLLAGGILVPLGELPVPLAAAGAALPSSALADLLREAFGAGAALSFDRLIVLGAWAAAAPAAAAALFRWE